MHLIPVQIARIIPGIDIDTLYELILVLLILWIWPVLTFLLLMIFRASMNKIKVRSPDMCSAPRRLFV